MRYAFPEITDMEPLRQIVLKYKGFNLIRREDHIVFCYSYNSPDVFPPISNEEDVLRRECRGIAFSPDGRVISRPYHKFFNVGEREETLASAVDLLQRHVILEKLDGSMIRPIPFGNGYRLGTKAGLTPVAAQPENFVGKNPHYDAYIRQEIERGRTPIFEWCSRQQRIVIDYPVDRLVLTAVRENVSGRYVPLAEIREEIAANPAFAGVEIVREYEGTAANMEALLSTTRALDGGEGFVIRFADGHMAKLKGEWYVNRHRALDGLAREKVVIATLLSGAADDVKALLPEEPRAKFAAFERQFWSGVEGQVAELSKLFADIKSRYGDDKKAFALGLAAELDQHVRSIMFNAWRGDDIREKLLEQIDKNARTSSGIDDVRWAFGGLTWSYDFDGDA